MSSANNKDGKEYSMLIIPIYDSILLPDVTFYFRKEVVDSWKVDELVAGQEIVFALLKDDIDAVAGVPDSGTAHAMGYANESGVPFSRPFVKYTPTWPRSFMPTHQNKRNLIAKMKLIPVHELIDGKKLLLIDDSIVRGTQLRETTEFLYDSGAKEVHMRIASPMFINPCYLTSDTTPKEDLIASRMTNDEICRYIGADSLGFLSPESLHEVAKECRLDFCDACFTGNYPLNITDTTRADKYSHKIKH